MPLALFAVLPQHNVAFTLSNNDHRSGTVAMKSASAHRRKLRHMAAIGGVRERKAHVPYSFSLHRKIVEGKLIDVWHQVGFPIAVGYMLVVTQKLFSFVKPITKIEGVAKDEVLVVKDIDHARASRAREQPDRFVAG